jgi:hypothetical protein
MTDAVFDGFPCCLWYTNAMRQKTTTGYAPMPMEQPMVENIDAVASGVGEEYCRI